MAKMITCFKSLDGRIFESEEEAQRHDAVNDLIATLKPIYAVEGDERGTAAKAKFLRGTFESMLAAGFIITPPAA